jgi:radical SAM protein with 4Fe4S-binding SPASM domain
VLRVNVLSPFSSERLEVPEGLTFFQHNGTYLVVNPQVGGRCLLSASEFSILKDICNTAGRTNLVLEGAVARAVAKLVLNWIVYVDGKRPKLDIFESRLNFVYYAITDGCNLRCPYCYASSLKRLPGELSTTESLNLVSQVAKMGAQQIVFTGGEPTLRKDLFKIVEHAISLGLTANIITNGTLIKDISIAKKFAELFNMVTVSLDGSTAELHDRTRGAGAFASTYRALKLLNSAGVVPQINHIVTSNNVEELERFATFMKGLEIGDIRLMSHNNLGRGAEDEFEFGWKDHMRVQEISWMSSASDKLNPDVPKLFNSCSVQGNCGMGGNEIYVDSIGNVYPCKLVTDKTHLAGNIRKQTLEEIFDHPKLRSMRNSTVFGGEYHEDCQKCYIKSSCGGGCRATHMSETFDIKRNSRQHCRILRHGIVSQLWQEAGVSRRELAMGNQEMTKPRLVKTGDIHPVFYDWKVQAAAAGNAASEPIVAAEH